MNFTNFIPFLGIFAAYFLLFLEKFSWVQNYVWKDVINTVIFVFIYQTFFIFREFCKRTHCPRIVTLALLLFVIIVNVNHAHMSTFVFEVYLWLVLSLLSTGHFTTKIYKKYWLWYNFSVPYLQPDLAENTGNVLSSALFWVWDTDTMYNANKDTITCV